MSIKGSSLQRFRARVDEVLADFFPVTILFNEVEIQGSGPGGRAHEAFMEGGQDPEFRFTFRLPKQAFPAAPKTGDAMEWLIDEETTLRLEIVEVPIRPYETMHTLTAKHRRRA